MTAQTSILIVDDERRFCDSLESLIASQGYRTKTAISVNEAIRWIEQLPFDIALLDVCMPDMNGFQLMDRIKKKSPDTTVIMLTGNASIEAAVEALKCGAYDYLKKPFDHCKLLKTIQNAIEPKQLKKNNDIINNKLIVSQNRYRYLVQNSPDLIYTLDSDGKFTFVSDSVKNIIGISPEKLNGQHFTSIILDDDIEKAQWAFNERRTGGRATSGVQIRLKTSHKIKNGFNRYIISELKATGMYQKNNGYDHKSFLGTHGVVRDISERKRLEQDLLHARRMESIGTLAGGIAHDFNNLLMGIQGNASLALSEIKPRHPAAERLQNIEQLVKSGSSLTKQLLGLGRGGKYEVQSVDINEIIDQTTELFNRTKKEIRIYKRLSSEAGTVEADKGQIEQVLFNLYINAWQAMPNGGDMHIGTCDVTFDKFSAKPYCIKPGSYIKISVKDTGIGMDSETQLKIFDPFFTTKMSGSSAGLGLASAYGIIQNHKGCIKVESETGKGSTFYIYLPVSDHTTTAAPLPTNTLEKGSGTILVVDDERMIVDLSRDMLEKLGYRVFTAIGGQEGVELYQRRSADINLVILDMIMPGMSGKEVFTKLKEINSDLKVLFSSGYSEDFQCNDIMKETNTGFIQKPFSILALSQKIKQIIEKAE